MEQNSLHFFSGVAFELIPAIDYRGLEEVSQLAKKNGREHLYTAAREALQKIQWARLSAMQASAIELEIINKYRPETLSCHPLQQVQHSKALFEMILHAKSALDNLSVCLNEVFELGFGGGNRDLKWPRFCAAVSETNQELGEKLSQLKPWLDKSWKTSESIAALRDYWIHAGAPVIPYLHPPSALGALPVPIRIPWSFRELDNEGHDKHFWRSQAFIDHHMIRAEELYNAALMAWVTKERSIGSPHAIVHGANKTNLLPVLATQSCTVNTLQLNP